MMNVCIRVGCFGGMPYEINECIFVELTVGIHPHDVVTNSILDEVNTSTVNGLKTYIADELEQCVKDAVYPTP